MKNTDEAENTKFQPDKAYLMWRSFERFKEFRDGFFRLNKETTVRTFKNQPESFLSFDSDKFVKHMSSMISSSLSQDKDKLNKFLYKVHESYKKELNYLSNRKEQFSMDILFQVIETLLMEVGANKAENEIQNLGGNKSAVTKQDLEQIMSYLRTYNKMTARFQAAGSMKKAIELSDDIISQSAHESMDIPILALDSMFNLITAQFILAQKFNCKQLLAGWRKDYGFDQDQESRVAKLLPPTASLIEFRNNYAKALQMLRSQKKEIETEMDLFLLRTVSNYYASWINQVANQINKPAA
ncbi:MAG: hypothetical protein MH321_11210 [Leptospiraceae bacterium]|nr:hypothetical protein [Leptospiraceae bacterium]